MVGHEHVALTFLEMLPTLYLYWQEEDSDPQLCPQLTWVISPEVTIAQHTAYHRSQAGKDACHNENGQAND